MKEMKVNKSVALGAIAGLLIAIIAVLLGILNKSWDNEALRSLTNLIVSAPTFIFGAKLNLPQVLQNILFFGYWAVLGAATAFLSTRKNPAFKIAAVICLIAVIFTHRVVQINLQQELEGVLRAIGEMFGGKIK